MSFFAYLYIPTINLDETDPEINPRLNLTPHKVIKKDVPIALNNTFGFGGHTASIIFRRYTK
jgi:3-oxoacyl-[acyl-carrier-protein] synthase II